MSVQTAGAISAGASLQDGMKAKAGKLFAFVDCVDCVGSGQFEHRPCRMSGRASFSSASADAPEAATFTSAPHSASSRRTGNSNALFSPKAPRQG